MEFIVWFQARVDTKDWVQVMFQDLGQEVNSVKVKARSLEAGMVMAGIANPHLPEHFLECLLGLHRVGNNQEP